MKGLLLLLIHFVVVSARLARPGGVRGLVAENVLLKQQLLVLGRTRYRAPNLTSLERFVLGLCILFVAPSRIPKVAVGGSTATLLKLHQCLVRRKYRALFSARRSRRRPGPKGPSEELVQIILELKRRNPLFGCRNIALIIATTFGINIDKDVVRRVLAKHLQTEPGGGGSSWLTVIGHAKDSLWSIDLFCCESILLKTHWVLVVMDHFTRRIIGFAVHVGDADGVALRMFNKIISSQPLPRYLSTDHGPLFRYHRWQANLRVLDIEPVKTVPYVPVSHPFVERLIGSVRRELLDQTVFSNSLDLERKLGSFRTYFNESRVPSAPGWPNTGRRERDSRTAASQHPRASMAVALRRALSTPCGRVATNSPWTGVHRATRNL